MSGRITMVFRRQTERNDVPRTSVERSLIGILTKSDSGAAYAVAA